MVQKMLHGLIALINIQFNSFRSDQLALSPHFEQSEFPDPFFDEMLLFIEVIRIGINEDISLIPFSPHPGVRFPIDLGIAHALATSFDQDNVIGCIEIMSNDFWQNISFESIYDFVSSLRICSHLG